MGCDVGSHKRCVRRRPAAGSASMAFPTASRLATVRRRQLVQEDLSLLYHRDQIASDREEEVCEQANSRQCGKEGGGGRAMKRPCGNGEEEGGGGGGEGQRGQRTVKERADTTPPRRAKRFCFYPRRSRSRRRRWLEGGRALEWHWCETVGARGDPRRAEIRERLQKRFTTSHENG